MKLGDLLAGLPDARVSGNATIENGTEIGEIRDDSRLVRSGDLFVAVPGTTTDGRNFLEDAISRGASAVVIEGAEGQTPPAGFRGTVVTVVNARHALAVMAANRFDSGRSLTLIAVTGTNGKTTTTYLLEAMLGAAGIRAGVVGTISYRLAAAVAFEADGDRHAAKAGGDRPASVSRPAPLTTPGSLALHALFAELHAGGATDVVLEASSHALDQGRLDGCQFRVAGLTNVTQDHLDYHGTMDRYLDAKAILFERLLAPATGVAVLPVDLPEGRKLRGRVRGRPVLGVAVTPGTAGADVVVETASMSSEGVRARLATPSGHLSFASPLVGDYNLANIVLAAGMAIARGLAPEDIARGIEHLAGVPGRLERVPNDRGVLCVVDYAHTPDALERAIAAVRPLVGPGGRLLTVFGCGGDRDRSKRPRMGEAAARGSDLAIVTSDNPRGEDPDAIIAMIVEGMHGLPAANGNGHEVIADRRHAIRHAVSAARTGDVLLIAGKGHEDYQIVGANRLHFDDREEAAAAFGDVSGGAVTT